ncbi:MAG: hypothetical protein ACJAW7_003304 [Candidatus Azotimanducaceae bacterium]|jgi:hypothetical protein
MFFKRLSNVLSAKFASAGACRLEGLPLIGCNDYDF